MNYSPMNPYNIPSKHAKWSINISQKIIINHKIHYKKSKDHYPLFPKTKVTYFDPIITLVGNSIIYPFTVNHQGIYVIFSCQSAKIDVE